MMVRRPLLEPNLSVGGMTFLAHLAVGVPDGQRVNSEMTPDDLAGARGPSRRGPPVVDAGDNSLATHGPGYPLLHLLPSIPTQC